MNSERTITLGQLLCNLSAAEDAEERAEALEKLEEAIDGYFDEQFIRVCMEEARKGYFTANIGKCLPPDMEKEDISFEQSTCGTILAKW